MTFGAYRTVKSFVNNCYGSVIIKPVRGDQAPAGLQRVAERGLRGRGLSDLALIILAAEEASVAHDGMSPQRTSESSRTGSLGFWRMTGIG